MFSLKEMINQIKYFNEKSKKGCIYMIGLKYPKKLHDLPLASRHHNGKLMCTLHDIEKYVVHKKNLQMYLK
jgi:hypothetical protein